MLAIPIRDFSKDNVNILGLRVKKALPHLFIKIM